MSLGGASTQAKRARREIRACLLGRQGQRCAYCNRLMAPPQRTRQGGPDTMTIDHVTPRSRGGSEHRWNLVLACRSCNDRKEDLTREEFEIARRYGLA